jgi:serine/threonine protein kinase/tetratricopeptide (TPR) repeat protein
MIGKTISHYKILEKLGEGGIGVAYRAEDTILRRSVVLKFINAMEDADPAVRKRLVTEAQAAASLSHPNIATIYEYEEVDDPTTKERRSFIAMEYIKGETLLERLSRGKLQTEEAISVLKQIALGLKTVHNGGIIHRDIKPANIMLATDGVVKVLDFGLAKLAGVSSNTSSGSIVGTVMYMSPEQTRGAQVDLRTDIWSFGVLLFQMLTQKYPFSGEHPAAVMYAICNDNPPDLSQISPGLPENLVQLCRRCLEKDPTNRPQSMDEILASLEGATAVRGRLKFREITRARQKMLIGICAGVLLLVIGTWLIYKPRGPLNEAETVKWRLAAFPFENGISHDSLMDLPMIIQSLFVQELAGVEGIGIYDPVSLNAFIKASSARLRADQKGSFSSIFRPIGITTILNGGVSKIGGNLTLQARLIDVAGDEVLWSGSSEFSQENELPRVIRGLSDEILSYFQVKVLNVGTERTLRPWISQRTQSMRAVREFMRAAEAIFRGEPGGEYLERSLAIDSMFISPRVWLIAMRVQEGLVEQAKRDHEFLKRIEADANPFERAMIGWAGAYIAKDTASQLRYLERALDYSPHNNILLYNLALIRFVLKDYTGAYQALEQTIRMEWQFSPAYYLAAKCQYRMRNEEAAKKILEESSSISPSDPGIYSLLSVISLREGDTLKSRNYQAEYLKSWEKFGLRGDAVYAGLGSEYYDEGLIQEALNIYVKASEANPARAEYHSVIGDILNQMGRKDSAIREYLVALRSDSTMFRLHYVIGGIYEGAHDTARALIHYREYLRRDSLSEDARLIIKRYKLSKN